MGSSVKMRVLLPVLLLFLSDISNAELPAPEITITRSAEELEISWTEVDTSSVEHCFVFFQFTHQVNGVNVTNEILQDRSISVPFQPCVDNHFIVRTRCVTGAVVAATATKDYFTSITENLVIERVDLEFNEDNTIQVSWSRPENCQACEILYLVEGFIGEKIFEYATTDTSLRLSPIQPCEELKVIVTPVDLGVMGTSYETSITAPAGSDVGAIRAVSINNGRIEWSGGDGICEVSYTVTVRDNYGSESVYTTNERFLDFDFVYCAMYNVMISSTFENAHVRTVQATHRPRPAEVPEVENLAVTEADGNIIVSWSPVVFGVCKAHYKLRHYINGILVGAALITETNREFGTNYCADNRVTVQAVVDMVKGGEKVMDHSAASTDPGEIRNLAIIESDGALIATWDPITVGFCPIHYIVDHIVNGNLIETVSLSSNVISLQRHSCSDNIIKVTPIASTHIGSLTSEAIRVGLESLNAVESLQVKEVEDGLSVSWSPVEEGFCDIVYTISNFDGSDTFKYTTELTTYTIRRTNCAKNTVSVTAAEPTSEVTSSPSYKSIDVDIDLTKVRNLSVNRKNEHSLEIDWERPEDSENCDISYIANVVVGDVTVLTKETTETELSVDVDIKPCQDFDVILTPVSPAGAKGQRANRADVARLFSLDPPFNLGKRDGRLMWYKPQDIGLCEIKFHVNIFNELGEAVREETIQGTDIEFQMTPCRRYNTSVRAIDVLTGLQSKDVVAEKIGEARILTQISTLEFFHLHPERLNVAWGAVDSGDCPLLYEVSQIINADEVFVFLTSETTHILDVAACTSNEIGVMPILEDGSYAGERFTQTVLVELDVLEPVTEIVVLPFGIAWNPPPLSGHCQIEYVVEVFDADQLIGVWFITDLMIEWHFVPCAQYTVRITPHYSGRSGPPADVTFLAQDVAHAPPTHIKTTTTLTTAAITFEANSREVTNCSIEEVRISCNTDSGHTLNRTITVEDNAERIFEVLLTELEPNTHFLCVAEWLPHNSAPSETFEFITRYIPNTYFEISNVTSDDFTINWQDPEGLEKYVDIFTVIIETQGPNHFVQESCDIDRNRIFSFNVARGQETFTFSDARPNFKYHVTLLTRFNLGVETTSGYSVINTLPGVPGPITDLSPKFNLEKCAIYSGDGAFVWTPPCDINGDLDRFEATLTTFYAVGGESRSHTTQITLKPQNIEQDYTFTAEMPTLNPFFEYSISVEVFAAYPGHQPSELTRVTPPPAYTSCDIS